MGNNDHSPWGINGLFAAEDGTVYVWGHSSSLGPPALRQYDAHGEYLRTVFPMSAGKEVDAMQAWGINVRPDGSYAPKFNSLTDPSLTTTILDSRIDMARLLSKPEPGRLTFWRQELKPDFCDTWTIHRDGTIDPDASPPGLLIQQPPFKLDRIAPNSHELHAIRGPVFIEYTPDGKSFFVSGLYATTSQYGSIKSITLDDFWRDGQVWKVDSATRTAEVFYALDKSSIPTSRGDRATAYGGGDSNYAALHGLAIADDGSLLVGDRLNQRIAVLNPAGKLVRSIPLAHVDAIALNHKTGALYVTTRWGDYHRRGELRLLKFKDWRTSNQPDEDLLLCETGFPGWGNKRSYLAVCQTEQGSRVWAGFTNIPVRVYGDGDEGLALVKDFSRVPHAQQCLGFERLQVDQQTETVYILDAHDSMWKVADWEQPRFAKVPLETSSIGIDARNRFLFARTLRDGSSSNSVGRIARFHLDEDYSPANYPGTDTNRVTEKMQYQWCFEGNADRGFAIAPNGNLAVAGTPSDGLRVFAGSESQVPWAATKIADLPANSGGVRFDLSGNLYVGYVEQKPVQPLPGFENEKYMAPGFMGRIHKFAPTGTLASGNLFPKPPAGPVHTYDVPCGAYETICVTRSPRFAVDGYGRIYYPTNIAQRVSIMDNAGNEILHFGTYGNRDSMGGLPGELVPTAGIPMAFPNSVDATDNYVYVADMVNLRVLRLKKTFQVVGVGKAGDSKHRRYKVPGAAEQTTEEGTKQAWSSRGPVRGSADLTSWRHRIARDQRGPVGKHGADCRLGTCVTGDSRRTAGDQRGQLAGESLHRFSAAIANGDPQIDLPQVLRRLRQSRNTRTRSDALH